MKSKKRSNSDLLSIGRFTTIRFVPGDHVKIEFDACSFVEVVVMCYDEKKSLGENLSGKEDDLPF